MELILPLYSVKRSNMKEGIYVLVHLCSVYDDPALCLFMVRCLSLLGCFHLAFNMVNVLTRLARVTGNW